MPDFIPGLELNRMFYAEAVRPILDARFPALRHSAALIGYGSDVLGYDSPRSTDHEWGPRLLLFLSDEDHPALARPVSQALSESLAPTFRGYSTSFGEPDENRVRVPERAAPGAVKHHVDILTPDGFLRTMIGIEPGHAPSTIEWLLLSEQKLLEITGGAVYYDSLGQLGRIRETLKYYPREVWLYLLSAQWLRIAQEEHFMSRCAEGGDDLGSRIVAARIARDLIRLISQRGLKEEEDAQSNRKKKHADALAEHARCAHEIRQLDEAVKRAAEIQKEIKVRQADFTLYAQLADDLRSERFQAFLLDEVFRDLVRGASERLWNLTEVYRLEWRDGAFYVVDHDNARQLRSTDTLSGGETFLASLALALQLSEQVQRASGAVPLDSLFIDEGFGTLDAETLDDAANAIERLPTGGRVVGIITHLDELSARLPARIKGQKAAGGTRLALEVG